MIVVDENIHSREIMASIAGWYRGRVISIIQLRPRSIILDDAIPTLLRQLDRPTFVTTNADDFWLKTPAHNRYCFICLYLPRERNNEAPAMLRALLSMPAFRTKAGRMGKVVRVAPSGIVYYGNDREIKTIQP
ncbi:MAG TPA: hypothetical protein PKJ56_10330 [Promineifilum sp.]|nr:hypothetical protein [Promineifilum sp.]